MPTVLVTGASRGIGRATAIAFARVGYNVIINYKSSKMEAASLLNEIKKISNAISICADVSDYDACARMFEEARSSFGKIDTLVCNAGIAMQDLITNTITADYRKILDTNLGGVYNCTKLALPDMIRNNYGRIITVSSIWGINGASCEVLYSASKAAVIGYTKALALEVAPSNITVNCIAPGVIDTDMIANLSVEDKKDLIASIPMGRIGRTQDITDSILFFASPTSSYITGQVLTISGGF